MNIVVSISLWFGVQPDYVIAERWYRKLGKAGDRTPRLISRHLYWIVIQPCYPAGRIIQKMRIPVESNGKEFEDVKLADSLPPRKRAFQLLLNAVPENAAYTKYRLAGLYEEGRGTQEIWLKQ